MADISFDERRRIVQAALTQARGSETYIVEMYEDRIVYETYGDGGDAGKSFEVPYTLADDNAVTFGDRAEVVREITYRRAVKFTGSDTIAGLAIPFGSYDTDREMFTKDTDLCIDWFGKSGRPFLFDHGMDPTLKGQRVGRQSDFEIKDEGLWAEVQLERNARYRKAIDRLIDEGALGYSSGAYPHLATKNAKGEITRWPWVELSGTPIPSHPHTLGIHYVKSASFLELLEDDVPAPLKAALTALDEWADTRDDESLPDGLKFAEHADRLLADVEAFRSRMGSITELRAKAGRVLSAPTRERLARHPSLLRELATDLDGLLSKADADKSAKSAEHDLLSEAQLVIARALDIELPAERNP